MAAVASLVREGFNFENFTRNEALLTFNPSASSLSRVQKTGTTICGCIYGEGNGTGIMLAADTRATAGPIVADKNCFKVHRITNKIWCCGAGTAADCDMVTRELEQNMEFQEMEMGQETRVVSVLTQAKRKLFRYQGYVGAYLIIAGIDSTGPNLFTCYAHGSSDCLPYVTMGSGSLAAMSVMETTYRPNMTADEARALVIEAIKGGINNDLGSGSNVDVVHITINGAELDRSVYSTERTDLNIQPFKPGAAEILEEEIVWTADVNNDIEMPEAPQDEAMQD